jgi:hypothetical protein
MFKWLSCGLLRRVVWSRFTDVSEVLTTGLHGATTHMTAVSILAALRT